MDSDKRGNRAIHTTHTALLLAPLARRRRARVAKPLHVCVFGAQTLDMVKLDDLTAVMQQVRDLMLHAADPLLHDAFEQQYAVHARLTAPDFRMRVHQS